MGIMEPSFTNFLRSIPGSNGISLSYIVRSNLLPDPTPNTDFMDEYAAMAILTGATFEVDSAEVYTYLVKFISGNNTAESKIESNERHSNGRLDYIALKEHYASVGVNAKDILRAESILEKLTYTGEKQPHMWWDDF